MRTVTCFSGRQIVDIAVSTIVANILVVDTCRPVICRTACKEARVQYLPSGRKNLRQHQMAITTRRRICDSHHSREVRTLLQSGGIHRMTVMIHIADGKRQTIRIGFLFALGRGYLQVTRRANRVDLPVFFNSKETEEAALSSKVSVQMFRVVETFFVLPSTA